MCEHQNDLGPAYVGIFCIYCGAPAQRLTVRDGQLILSSPDRRVGDRYLAVVSNGQQREVSEALFNRGVVELKYASGPRAEVHALDFVKAIQGAEEVLEILETPR